MPLAQIPESIRQQEAGFTYQALLQYEGPEFLIRFGPRVLTLITRRHRYPGWARFREELAWLWEEAAAAGFVQEGERLAVRYVDFFAQDIFSLVVLGVSVAGQEFAGMEQSFSTVIPWEDSTARLVLSNGAFLSDGRETHRGSILDLEVWQRLASENVFVQAAIYAQIERLHEVNKKLFFGLLKPEFLGTLYPVYCSIPTAPLQADQSAYRLADDLLPTPEAGRVKRAEPGEADREELVLRKLGPRGWGRLYHSTAFLRSPGWGEGRGRALSPRAIEAFYSFLDSVQFPAGTQPSIFLTDDGGLELCWEDRNGKSIQAAFLPSHLEVYRAAEESPSVNARSVAPEPRPCSIARMLITTDAHLPDEEELIVNVWTTPLARTSSTVSESARVAFATGRTRR